MKNLLNLRQQKDQPCQEVFLSCTLTPHLNLPVVGGGLIELLSQREDELCVLDGALSLHRHLGAVHCDDGGGLCQDADLTRGEADT